MRELFLDNELSTDSTLVLRGDNGEEYSLAVTDKLRARITPTAEPDAAPSPALSIIDEDANDDAASEGSEGAEEDVDKDRSLPTPDPLYSNPLTLRPREIQERVRAGASSHELAEEMGVAYSRVEPYAHPVMLERERMAEVAKQAHPVREDGPAKLTLWEVLAAAFGTRGYSLSDAQWDAFKEPGGAWIIKLVWQAGLSENSAEWVLRNHLSSSPTAEARNAVAADLTDPDFVQPVRTLTSVSRGERYEEDLDTDPSEFEDFRDDMLRPDRETEPVASDGSAEDDETVEGEEFLQNPEPAPTKRRRKAVTPHWEDVLLGVRTNTKRPRN